MCYVLFLLRDVFNKLPGKTYNGLCTNLYSSVHYHLITWHKHVYSLFECSKKIGGNYQYHQLELASEKMRVTHNT